MIWTGEGEIPTTLYTWSLRLLGSRPCSLDPDVFRHFVVKSSDTSYRRELHAPSGMSVADMIDAVVNVSQHVQLDRSAARPSQMC
jgi:hypothetical protein